MKTNMIYRIPVLLFLILVLSNNTLLAQNKSEPFTSYFKTYYSPELKAVQLNWKSTEVNKKPFLIERTVNGGTTWNVIGNVIQPEQDTSKVYSFQDKHPVVGLAFYRIKQESDNGSFSFSTVKSALVTNSRYIIFPNPLNDFTQIYSSDKKPETVAIQITDLEDKVIKEVTGELSEAHPLKLQLKDLAKGDYLLKINAGNDQSIQKLIVIQEDIKKFDKEMKIIYKSNF